MEHLSSYSREYNDIDFAVVAPDQTCAVPLIFADYIDFSIEPDIPEYVIMVFTHVFINTYRFNELFIVFIQIFIFM